MENKKEYTIEEVRKLAGTIDIYRTRAGYIYTKRNGKNIYVMAKKNIGEVNIV